MKKAEMESHCVQYSEKMTKAHKAEQDRLYHDAVELAVDSWEHIDGMMQYERRFANAEIISLAGLDLPLRYAPLLLDFDAISKLETLLKDRRRIEKNTVHDYAEKIAKARERMWRAHRMWHHLEENGIVRQDELRETLGGDQDEWRATAETWERMGLVRRCPVGRSYMLEMSTRMGGVVPGKCPACGDVTEAPKAMFLEKLSCRKCHKDVMFVLLARPESTE